MSYIVLDIGHANGTGARGMGAEEHAVCCKIAGLLKEMLESACHTVEVIDFPEMSNEGDLNATIRAANAIADKSDFGISLHCDCSDNKEAHGAHCCYVSSSGKRLAESIAKPLCALMPGRADKTVLRTGLRVLNKTRDPWVLVECGFISNKTDNHMLTRNTLGVAHAIFEGIPV